MKKLSKEHLVKIRELQNILASLEVFDDFQKFVDENEVESCLDLKKNYRPVYNKFYSKKFGRSLNYPSTGKWKDYNELNDFQNFIYEHKIKNRQQFDKEFRGLSCRAERYGFINQLKYCPDDKDLVTVEEATKFIFDNEIKTIGELDRRFHDKFLLFSKVLDKIEFPGLNRHNWEDFKVFEDFQKFINDNKILRRIDASNLYPGFCRRASILGFWNDLVFEIKKPVEKYKIKERFKSENDVKLFLIKSNIKNKKQLLSTEEGKALSRHCYRMGWKLNFSNPLTHKIELEMYDEFQKFIEDNNVQNCTDFRTRFPGIAGKAQRLGFSKELIFPHPRLSSLELKIKRKLDELGISYEIQKTFSDLQDIRRLRFDFYIKDYNLILEPGGVQHLRPEEFFDGEKGFEILSKHDALKREFCKRSNISIIYYFEAIRSNISKEEFNTLVSEYPGECYTKDTFDEMFDRILSL